MKKQTKTAEKATTTRSISASEIARNIKHFETWSSCHGCEQVAFSDLPAELKDDVMSVFDVEGKLPTSLARESSSGGQLSILAPEIASFIRKVYREAPSLFTADRPDLPLTSGMFSELHCVYLAWKQLQRMRKSKEKWSESDFAANVYNVFRTPAVRESAYRNQCTISLPERLLNIPLTTSSARVFRAKSVVPDSAIFIRASSIRALSQTKLSPWKRLNGNSKVRKHCTVVNNESAFRYQSSPCAQPPEHPTFEFASSFWEDKKPNCDLLETAYRQNRMATTAAVRHLHSLGVQAPVFGLVWANGTVRAHVDWCSGEGEQLAIQSAPYPGPQPIAAESISTSATTPDTSICTASSVSNTIFHEWCLDRPSDILRVFLLIRNIDVYTAGPFREHIELGVEALVAEMDNGADVYRPWKISPNAGALRPVDARGNGNENAHTPQAQVQAPQPPPPPTVTGFPTPPQAPAKRIRNILGKGNGPKSGGAAGRKNRER